MRSKGKGGVEICGVCFIGYIYCGCYCGRVGVWIVIFVSRGLGNDWGVMLVFVYGFVMMNWVVVVMGEVCVL